MIVAEVTHSSFYTPLYVALEKGYFKYGGSTIVLLFEKNRIALDEEIINNSLNGLETYVKYGEKIGEKKK
ncbi:hypothetical protein EGR52_02710 [bacterium]|nr:hypothetical protein [bacterium]